MNRWERFDACHSCGAELGASCVNKRTGAGVSRAHTGRPRVQLSYVPPRERRYDGDQHGFFRMLGRMVQAAGRRVAKADVEDLRELIAMSDDLDGAIRAGIVGLRANGYTWKSIGEELEPPVTGQAVYLRWGKPKPERPAKKAG